MRWRELLSEKRKHHHKHHHAAASRYGFYPRLGIYACASCGHQCPIQHATDNCPSCGTPTADAPVNTGGAAPAVGA